MPKASLADTPGGPRFEHLEQRVLLSSGPAAVEGLSADSGDPVSSQPFTDIKANLAPVELSALAWGDCDNDGDLDLALAGTDGAGTTRVYRNDGSDTFADAGAALIGVEDCSLAWGDYDNDGDLDLALAGWDAAGSAGVSRIYRNDGANTFTDISASLPGVDMCSLAWGDYDNDGDLDLALAGWHGAGSVSISRIYRNEGADVFADIGAGLTGVYMPALAWGDYDNDGDLDLALAGYSAAGRMSLIYRNDGDGVFADIQANLTGLYTCSLAWGDYDSDGDLDLAAAGYSTGGRVSLIYANDGGAFADVGAALTGVDCGALAWGDYDNDGDLDLAIAGYADGGPASIVYGNEGGLFADVGAGLTGAYMGSLAWGDYDADGDLDLALAGYAGDGERVSLIYRNNAAAPNTPPGSPLLPAGLGTGDELALSWSAATDVETPAAALTYNVRVGTTPGGEDVLCGMAETSTGLRRAPAAGNAQHNLSWTIVGLAPGWYYWSVQAIDACLAGSAWADEQASLVPLPGDANRNGAVDGADYTAWADHYNQPGAWADGDFGGDGFVDGSDYTAWADYYGEDLGAPAEGAAAALVLALEPEAIAPPGLPGREQNPNAVPRLQGPAPARPGGPGGQLGAPRSPAQQGPPEAEPVSFGPRRRARPPTGPSDGIDLLAQPDLTTLPVVLL